MKNKEVPTNTSIIEILEEYGCNKEYAIKCIQMNKHNSVTTTYYLLLKNKKRDFIQKLEKSGKNTNKYFHVNNEKQELINLLMNFVPSSKKKPVKNKEEVKKEQTKERWVESLNNESKFKHQILENTIYLSK